MPTNVRQAYVLSPSQQNIVNPAITKTAVDEAYDNLFLAPAAAYLAGAVPPTLTIASVFPALSFGASGVGSAYWGARFRTNWSNVTFQARIVYTCATGSTNTFSLAFSPYQQKVGAAVSAFVNENITGTAVGPGTANFVETVTLKTSTVSFTAADEVLSFRLQRLGPDSNANALLVMGVYISAIPMLVSL
jgi:hypothetical protein